MVAGTLKLIGNITENHISTKKRLFTKHTIMLWSALIFGLLGSFHCIGMCGPIAFVLPIPKGNKSKSFFGTSLYHIGRILSYSLIGLLFGLLGKGLYLAGFQQRLSILIGIIMILIILIPTRVLNKFH